MRYTLSIRPYCITLLLTLLAGYCTGQKLVIPHAQPLRDARLVILSEWHLADRFPPCKRALIAQLYQEEGLTDIILEAGKSAAYLLNEYIRTGDTGILQDFPLFMQRDRDYWKNLRSRTAARPLTIHGIDFERMNLVPALKRALAQSGHTTNELYRYLSSLSPDTLRALYEDDKRIAARGEVIRQCIAIYQSDKAYYSSIYDQGYIVRDICENPALETEWAKRFDAMGHNLRMLYQGSDHKYLLIVGIYHVDCTGSPYNCVPIYTELMQAQSMQETDLVNIAMIARDCEAEAMYQGRGKVALASSKSLLEQTIFVDALFRRYAQPCKYFLVDRESAFPGYKPAFQCDYILPVDCSFDSVSCD